MQAYRDEKYLSHTGYFSHEKYLTQLRPLILVKCLISYETAHK